MYITSQKTKEIQKYLMNEHEYDVTITKKIGGYTGRVDNLILCSVDKERYYEIKEGILLIDPDAFIVVTKSYEQKNANHALRKSKINT